MADDLTALHRQFSIAQISWTSAAKRKQFLEANMPADETISAWCADLTEDLTGEIGTVEIPGETAYIQIQPGYESNAVYNIPRDGQLLPTVIASAAQSFYNLAMMPGWQKWKPLFRYGTITAIDGDTASVAVEGITSSQQSLVINQTDSLSDVAIEYMNCNGGAFEVDDEVLLKFEGQAWDSPVVVGFKDNPKPCTSFIYIRPTFNGNYADFGGQRITIKYTFEQVNYEFSKDVYQGVSGDDLTSYTETPFEIPPEVISAETIISVYLSADWESLSTHDYFKVARNKTFTFWEDVGKLGAFDRAIRYGSNNDDVFYGKRVLEKEADQKLLSGVLSSITILDHEYVVYDVDFTELKIIERSPTFAYYERAENGDLTYIDNFYPYCLHLDYYKGHPEYTWYMNNFGVEVDVNDPIRCPEYGSANAFGEGEDQYCTAYASMSTETSDRPFESTSVAIVSDEYGTTPIFTDHARTITQTITYWYCELCPWGECSQPEGAVFDSEYQYIMTWTCTMIETPPEWW